MNLLKLYRQVSLKLGGARIQDEEPCVIIMLSPTVPLVWQSEFDDGDSGLLEESSHHS